MFLRTGLMWGRGGDEGVSCARARACRFLVKQMV